MRKRFWRAIDWFLGPRLVHNVKLEDYVRKQARPITDKDLLGKDADGHSWPSNEQKLYPH